MADSSAEIPVEQGATSNAVQNENKDEPFVESNDRKSTVGIEPKSSDEGSVESKETCTESATHTKDAVADVIQTGNDSSNDEKMFVSEGKKEGTANPDEEGLTKDKADPGKTRRTPPAERKDKKRDDISDEQRKAKIEEIRKRKLTDYKKKEDEKRKAVLERKKKLEEAERAKHEALLKKISSTSVAPKRPVSAPARRAASFSSLAYLKKTHVVAQEIEIGDEKPKKAKEAEDKSTKPHSKDTDKRRTLPPRPMSAMERKRPSSFSSDKGSKPLAKNGSEADKTGVRPRSSFGGRVEPKIRQSISNLPNRPASAASSRTAPKKPDELKGKSTTARPRPSMPPLPGKPLVPPSKEKEMKKAKSASSVLPQGAHSKGPVQPGKKAPESAEKAKPKAAPPRPSSSSYKPKPDLGKPQRSSPGRPDQGAKPTAIEKRERRSSKEGSPAGKAGAPKKAAVMDEAEAKRIMAEKRRQVKEEQERKKLEEENRLEEERIRKEEEQKKRAEELLKEQERQKAHLEELQKEAEERDRKEKEEKLRKELEEKERLEAEKRLRQEDIDRRAQEEVEKRAKEREHKRQQEEAERLERKKRVQEILGTRLRGSPVGERPVSPIPFATANSEEAVGENSPPAIDTASSARDRVQKLLEKNQKKSEDSYNDGENGEAPNIVKPLLSPVQTSPKTNEENSSQQTVSPGSMKTNGQATADHSFSESSLTEADKLTMEDEKRKNSENVDHSIKNGTDSSIQDSRQTVSLEDEKNVEIKEEEKHLWNEAEKVMADNQDNISNSFEKQTPTRNDQTQSNQENSLWQLVEGKLELEECF